MGNYWHVYPLKADEAEWLKGQGLSVPPSSAPSTGPTPNQLFSTLRSFPEYHVRFRREDRKRKEMGQDVVVELRREDGSYAISIRLIGVHADDWPVGEFCFEYYRETEELVRLVAKLAELCGPLFLYDDSGCEKPILINPARAADRGP
jgi:hypothetical protein